MGNLIFVLWLVAWIVSALFIRKASGSWVTSVGGGLLLSLLVLGITLMLKSGVEHVLYPNPSVKDWEISEPPPPQGLSKEKQREIRAMAEKQLSGSGSHPSLGANFVFSLDYGSRWSFTVSSGELECINNAVIMHTDRGTYSINGKAMDRYAGRYPEFREIAKPYPGLENDPSAKMPPPHDLIKKGLALCK